MKTICGFVTLVIVAAMGSLWYMKSNYQTTRPCVALSRAVAEETPEALSDLAKKYPIQVGIFWGLSRLISGVDDKIRELTAHVTKEILYGGNEAPSELSCFGVLMNGDLDREVLRAQLVIIMERTFGLIAQGGSERVRRPAVFPTLE